MHKIGGHSPHISTMLHTVFFWLKNDLSPENRDTFEKEILRLVEIPGIVRGFVGKPAPTEERPVTDHSFDYSLTLQFKNLEDHEHYQKRCERHARFVNVCNSFWERVAVYDSSPIR